jgi:hypothetical protein
MVAMYSARVNLSMFCLFYVAKVGLKGQQRCHLRLETVDNHRLRLSEQRADRAFALVLNVFKQRLQQRAALGRSCGRLQLVAQLR